MEGYFLYIANKLDRIRNGDTPEKFDILRELRGFELWRAVLAEFIATMLFVFMGTMSAVALEPATTMAYDVVNVNGTARNITIEYSDGSAKYVRVSFSPFYMKSLLMMS